MSQRTSVITKAIRNALVRKEQISLRSSLVALFCWPGLMVARANSLNPGTLIAALTYQKPGGVSIIITRLGYQSRGLTELWIRLTEYGIN